MCSFWRSTFRVVDCDGSPQCLPLRIEHCLFGGLSFSAITFITEIAELQRPITSKAGRRIKKQKHIKLKLVTATTVLSAPYGVVIEPLTTFLQKTNRKCVHSFIHSYIYLGRIAEEAKVNAYQSHTPDWITWEKKRREREEKGQKRKDKKGS